MTDQILDTINDRITQNSINGKAEAVTALVELREAIIPKIAEQPSRYSKLYEIASIGDKENQALRAQVRELERSLTALRDSAQSEVARLTQERDELSRRHSALRTALHSRTKGVK